MKQIAGAVVYAEAIVGDIDIASCVAETGVVFVTKGRIRRKLCAAFGKAAHGAAFPKQTTDHVCWTFPAILDA